MQSDWLPVGNCGNGSIRTKRSLESEDHISIETHRMSLRLMAKSMPLTASSRIRNMLNRRPRSSSLCTTITACRTAQEWQDLQGRNPDHKRIQFDSSPSRVRTGTRFYQRSHDQRSKQSLSIYRTSKVRLPCALLQSSAHEGRSRRDNAAAAAYPPLDDRIVLLCPIMLNWVVNWVEQSRRVTPVGS